MNRPNPIGIYPGSPGTSGPQTSTVRTAASRAWLGLTLGVAVAASAHAADYTYVKVGDPARIGGYPYGMDNQGRVVTTSLVRSFLFADNFHASYLEITNVNVATSTPGMLAQGINDLGEVVGRYRTNGLPANQTRGFIRRADGTFEPFDYPGVASTAISDINNLGHMVGETRSDLTAFGLTRGFVHTNGVSAEIHFPGAVLSRAYGINDAGDIVGQYQLEDSVNRPFLLRNGAYSEIVPTGSPDGLLSALAFNISDNGMVLGTYRNTNNVTKTWVMLGDGTFSYPELPGSGRTINNAGQISGTYNDATNSNAATAFVATPKVEVNFLVHRIALTNSASAAANKINDFGQITGTVDGTDGVSRGYLFDTATGHEVERAGYPGSDYTEWGGITSAGTIAGYYADPADPTFGTYRAFTRDSGGNYTAITWSGDPDFGFTVDIDEHGRVAGGGNNTAWVWNTNGTFNVFNVPGFTVNGAFGMNDRGLVVGAAWPGFFDTPNGLIYNISNNTATSWNYPAAAQTTLYGINNRGDIVGEFKPNLTSATIPFVRWANGATQILQFAGLSGVRVYDINDDRIIVGRYKDAANKNRSFYATPRSPLPAELAFTFESVTATLPGATETLLSDIDNNGRIVGRFKDSLGESQGLTIDGGNQSTFNITGTSATFPGGFNALGVIAGFYRNATNTAIQHGFIRATNGTVTTIDGAVPGTTYVWRVNEHGEANGYWFEDSPFFIRSFRRDTNGTLTTFVYPGSPVGTVTRGMNDAGDLAGWKWTDAFALEGVVFKRDGTTNVFTVPGWANTLPGDINNFGEIAGTVINADFTKRAGFFRRANGDTVVFTPPQAIEVEVFGLNDQAEIVGEYVTAGGSRLGFIARPATRLDHGHTDAGLAYEDGEFEFHIHDEENDVEYGVNEAVLAVGTAAELTIPDEVAYSFLGRAGYSTWVLPATESEELLFLGLAAEEIETGIFVNDQIRIELVFVQGNGDFALYSIDGLGNPVIHMNTADGYDDQDAFVVQAGSHQHLNWAFSAPGTYRVGFRARATLVEGNTGIESDVAYYAFIVPEPLRTQPVEPEEEIYTITDLGTLGGPSSFALDVNESAQVTGNARYTNANSRLHAFAWDKEVIRDLGYLTNGIEFSRGYAINDSGIIVGESDNDISKAFLWDGTNMVQLGTLGGASAVAHDINNAGEIVGASSNGSASRPYKRDAAGMMHDLGTLLGTTNSTGRAWGINQSGAVVGLSRNEANTTSQATLWIGGSISNLGSLADGTLFSQAYAINDDNVVVGSSVIGKVSPTSSTDLYHAFVWEDGVMTDLGAHPSNTNYIHSEAKDINNAGDIVGYTARFFSSPTSGGAAMLWRDGEAIDLNTLVPPGSGWVLQSAEGINEHGDIVGYGSFKGQTRAFLLRRATIYADGHADFAFDYANGAWHQRMRNDNLGSDLEPATVLVRGNVASQLVVPTDLPAGYEFLGQAGDTIWILPEVQDPRLPFLGLAAEETGIETFLNRDIRVQLLNAEGPGQFLTSDAGFTEPRVFFNTRDGIGPADFYPLTAGSHAHLNWIFTSPGYYRVTFQASGTLADGGGTTIAAPVTYHFQIIGIETRLNIVRADSGLKIVFATQTGVNYQLERAPEASGPWENAGQPFVGTGRAKEISVPAANGNAFFRINASVRQ